MGKSHGVYSCPTRILKIAKTVISTPLMEITNNSILQGTFPGKLKLAKVVPVYKNDDATDPNNHRPISLLSIFNRIFEKLVYKRLKSFLEVNDVFYESQHGFREKHSTQHAILDIVNKIQGNMDKGMYSRGIFIDLKKAFDTFNHTLLLKKLCHYGVRGIVNDWFSSYLDGRSQVTQIGDYTLEKVINPCFVPQGSVLGPLLFLLYINDIQNSSDLLDLFLFADDTTLLYSEKSLQTLEKVVHSELTKVCEWLTVNRLSLNIQKSNYVIFHPPQKKIDREIAINVYDNTTGQYLSLDLKNYVKFLGVLIDGNLKWSHHINFVALKISRIVGIIARLRHFVPTQTLLMIYRSLILPYLTYGICVWGHASKFVLNKLLILQKRVLRLIYFTPRNEHAIPLFIKSMILPVTVIYFETIANLMHDISHGSAPSLLRALFLKSNEVHRYNTRSAAKGNFFQKDAKLEIQKRSFSRFGTLVWNNIAPALRDKPKTVYRKTIRNSMFNLLSAEDDYVEINKIVDFLKSLA